MASGVSVIIAVRNGENYLAAAIESILGQTIPVDEIIVADDGSSDGTVAIARSFGGTVKVLPQQQAGQAAAQNAGITAATGHFLSFNDHDDLWTPDRLALQLAALTADPALDAAFGLAEQFISPELNAVEYAHLMPPTAIMRGELAQCMLIRTSSFHRIGALDESLASSAFIDWFGRAKREGFRSLMIEQVVMRRRLHLTNYGRTSVEERNRNHLLALRRHIQNRRAPT